MRNDISGGQRQGYAWDRRNFAGQSTPSVQFQAHRFLALAAILSRAQQAGQSIARGCFIASGAGRSVHQLAAAYLPYVADFRGPSRYSRLHNFPQDHRHRLVVLLVDDRVGVDEDEGETRIVRTSIAVPALVAKPDIPVRLVE